MDGSDLAKRPSEIILVYSQNVGSGAFCPPIVRVPGHGADRALLAAQRLKAPQCGHELLPGSMPGQRRCHRGVQVHRLVVLREFKQSSTTCANPEPHKFFK